MLPHTKQPLAFGKCLLCLLLPTPADEPKAWVSGSLPIHPHCFPGNIFPAMAGVFVTCQVLATLQTEGFMYLLQFCDEVAHLLAFLGQTGFWGRLHWWRSFAGVVQSSSTTRILTKLLFFFIFILQGNFTSSFQKWTWLMQSLHLSALGWIIRRNQISAFSLRLPLNFGKDKKLPSDWLKLQKGHAELLSFSSSSVAFGINSKSHFSKKLKDWICSPRRTKFQSVPLVDSSSEPMPPSMDNKRVQMEGK